MSSVRSLSPTVDSSDGRLGSPQDEGVPPNMTIQSVSYPNVPMHIYPFPAGSHPSPPLRSKRRQVKNACTNCQKACKKCDDARPCLRCVKYGVAEECIDSQRKERRKGVKRGPYKKRDGKNRASSDDAPDPEPAPAIAPGLAMPMGMPPPGAPMPMMAPMGYHPGFYGQMPPMMAPGKPGEQAYYPMFYMPPPPPPPTGQEGEPNGYGPPPQQFYQAFMPYAPPYPAAYMMPHPGARPDGPMGMPPPHFAYPPPQPFYGKQPSAGPSNLDEGRRDGRDGPLDDGRA